MCVPPIVTLPKTINIDPLFRCLYFAFVINLDILYLTTVLLYQHYIIISMTVYYIMTVCALLLTVHHILLI